METLRATYLRYGKGFLKYFIKKLQGVKYSEGLLDTFRAFKETIEKEDVADPSLNLLILWKHYARHSPLH